jgi:hypothetical protein
MIVGFPFIGHGNPNSNLESPCTFVPSHLFNFTAVSPYTGQWGRLYSITVNMSCISEFTHTVVVSEHNDRLCLTV